MQHADAAKALGDDGGNTMGAFQRTQPLCCAVPREENVGQAFQPASSKAGWKPCPTWNGRDSMAVFFDVQHSLAKFWEISAVRAASLIRIGSVGEKRQREFRGW